MARQPLPYSPRVEDWRMQSSLHRVLVEMAPKRLRTSCVEDWRTQSSLPRILVEMALERLRASRVPVTVIHRSYGTYNTGSNGKNKKT